MVQWMEIPKFNNDNKYINMCHYINKANCQDLKAMWEAGAALGKWSGADMTR